MKKFSLLLCLFLPYCALGQNLITVDLDNNSVTSAPSALNMAVPFHIQFSHCGTLGQFSTISFGFALNGNPHPTIEQDCLVPHDFNVNTLFGAGANGDLTVTLANKNGSSLRLINKFVIHSDGTIHDFAYTSAPVYYDKLQPVTSSTQGDSFMKDYQVVVYNPCGNHYTIYRNGTPHRSLSYNWWTKKDNGHGVILLIRDFNVLKYDITLTSTFNNKFTDVPDIFTSVSGMIAGGAAPANNIGDLATELDKILRLNTELKTILDQDCLDFESRKQQVMKNALLNFGPNGIVGIDVNYNSYKAAVLNDIQINAANPQPKYAAGDFNKDFQSQFHLPVTPDSLVTETIKLYNLLLGTRFYHQSNIIQLQNADELQYTLTIAGKSGVTNTVLDVNGQPLTIPILGGGIKVDFSSGFYYSNVRNQAYALRKNTTTDTGKNDIISEGNNGGKTIGVDALMHIYPRLLNGFNPALTFGLGKSLDLNYSVLLGFSLLAGRNNHFVFSGGMNISNIKMLSKAYIDNSGKPIPQPVSLTNINTYNGFKRGAFLSFSYAFGGTAAKTQTASDTSSGDNSKSDSTDSSDSSKTGKGGKGK